MSILSFVGEPVGLAIGTGLKLFQGYFQSGFGALETKDVAGACALGYGNENAFARLAQTVNYFKYNEKNSWHKWIAPMLPILATTLYNSKGTKPGIMGAIKNFPGQLWRKLSHITAKDLYYVGAVFPLFETTRFIKGSLLTTESFDPSGSMLFRIAQAGLVNVGLDIATREESIEARVAALAPVMLNSIANAVMMNTSSAYCHTFSEMCVGVVLGTGMLAIAGGFLRLANPVK
jgi:hypothetical protein